MFTGPSEAGKETCAPSLQRAKIAIIAVGLVLSACGKERPFAEGAPTSPDMSGLGGAPGQEPASAGGAVEACATPPCTSSPELVEPVGGIMGAGDGTDDLAGENANAECADGATESCGPSAEEGICRFGTRTCAAGVWGECSGAVLPGARDCGSAEDNDCDGQPDNTIDDACRCAALGTQPCDEHPELDGRGPCRAGVQTCVLAADNATSDWGECTGSIGPQPADSCEVASDDANCDGVPNGGCTCVEGTVIACGPEADTGECVRGTSTCTGGAFTECVGAVFPTRRDCTSALDNDCDGLPDDTIDAVCRCQVGSQRDCGDAPGSFGCALGTEGCEAIADGSRSDFTACSFAPVANASSCDDLNVLTSADSCEQGSCVGIPWGVLAAGNGGVCAVRAEGRVFCWAPSFGAVFDGPPEEVLLLEPARSVSVGARQACALLESGGVRCWGSNDSGQFGTGDTTSAPASAPATTSLAAARMVVAGSEGTIALDTSGTARLWGNLPAAVSGVSAALLPALTPRSVAEVSGASMVALGARHACALFPSQQVYCWGQNEFLQLGGGEQSPTEASLIVPGITDAIAIEAGQTSTCALRRNGQVSCWGALGCSSTVCAVPPTDVPSLTDARQVSVGGGTACALRASGGVVCWGTVGDGTVAVPAPVLGLTDAVAIAATDELDGHCALRTSGDVVCWRSSLELQSVVGLPN